MKVSKELRKKLGISNDAKATGYIYEEECGGYTAVIIIE